MINYLCNVNPFNQPPELIVSNITINKKNMFKTFCDMATFKITSIKTTSAKIKMATANIIDKVFFITTNLNPT